MVKFYETYIQVEFLNMTKRLHLFEFVQFPIAQLTTSEYRFSTRVCWENGYVFGRLQNISVN